MHRMCDSNGLIRRRPAHNSCGNDAPFSDKPNMNLWKSYLVIAQPRLAAQIDFFIAAGGAALPPHTLGDTSTYGQ
jgi:hypothetical protein